MNKRIHKVFFSGIIGIVVIVGAIFLVLNNRDESIPGNPDDNGFFTEDSTINGKVKQTGRQRNHRKCMQVSETSAVSM